MDHSILVGPVLIQEMGSAIGRDTKWLQHFCSISQKSLRKENVVGREDKALNSLCTVCDLTFWNDYATII